jgi:hypothetical protein
MKKNLILIFTVFTLIVAEANAKRIKYSPVPNITIEQAFPHAAATLSVVFKTGFEEFDYGKKILKSTWYEYYSGLLKQRCKFVCFIDDSNTFHVDVTEVQYKNTYDIWEKSSENVLFKTEEKFKATIAENVRQGILNAEVSTENKKWFFRNLKINTLFFENATDLAGERWFKNHLENKEINWQANFVDIEKNSNSNQDYKYKETYSYATSSLSLGSVDLSTTNLYIVKYTNKDNNVLTQKGDNVELNGYCRTLFYKAGIFYVTLTEDLETKVPVNTLQASKEETKKEEKSILEVAGKLKELKELLDLGAITEEEYNTEKDKLLNRN